MDIIMNSTSDSADLTEPDCSFPYSDVHNHCLTCYRQNCSSSLTQDCKLQSDACDVVKCPVNCGAQLHRCKLQDHQMNICPHSIVHCTNRQYGCPIQVVRERLSSHIEKCPASVITCSHEWNRWRKSFKSEKPNIRVPDIMDLSLSKTCTTNVLDVALASRDQSKLDEALQVSKEVRDSLCNAFTVNFPAMPFIRGAQYHEERDSSTGQDTWSILEFLEDDSDCQHIKVLPPGLTPIGVPTVHCRLCKARQKDSFGGLASSIRLALSKIAENNDNEIGDLNSQHHVEIVSTTDPPLAREKVKPTVQLHMEMLNSFRTKPKQMFTFLCYQDFRRDQFASHYKNVHCDIQSGLDGWFQIRCPLAIYGCSYTVQKFVTDTNKQIIYNPAVECFSPISKSDNKDNHLDPNSCWISSLPEEVLLILLNYLDSQSLRNLSLASKSLRNSCSELLLKRGIVSLDWRRENNKWFVYQQIWSFSNAFSTVDQWKYSNDVTILNHLSTCSFYDRHITSTDQFKYSDMVV